MPARKRLDAEVSMQHLERHLHGIRSMAGRGYSGTKAELKNYLADIANYFEDAINYAKERDQQMQAMVHRHALYMAREESNEKVSLPISQRSDGKIRERSLRKKVSASRC